MSVGFLITRTAEHCVADTAENVRTYLVNPQTVGGYTVDLTQLVGQRVHVDHAPQLDALLNALCEPDDIKPYIWVSRSTTDRDSCLGEVGTRPDSETFDVECVSRDLATAKTLAAQIHRLDSADVVFDVSDDLVPELVPYDLFVEEQSDDYQDHNGSVELGLFVAALSIVVIKSG